MINGSKVSLISFNPSESSDENNATALSDLISILVISVERKIASVILPRVKQASTPSLIKLGLGFFFIVSLDAISIATSVNAANGDIDFFLCLSNAFRIEDHGIVSSSTKL